MPKSWGAACSLCPAGLGARRAQRPTTDSPWACAAFFAWLQPRVIRVISCEVNRRVGHQKKAGPAYGFGARVLQGEPKYLIATQIVRVRPIAIFAIAVAPICAIAASPRALFETLPRLWLATTPKGHSFGCQGVLLVEGLRTVLSPLDGHLPTIWAYQSANKKKRKKMFSPHIFVLWGWCTPRQVVGGHIAFI